MDQSFHYTTTRERIMKHKVVTRNEKKVIGIEIRTSNQLETHLSTAKIPKAWQEFFDCKMLANIPNKSYENTVLGVYTNYESDQNGRYSLVIGCEVTSLDLIPDGMTGICVAPVKYLEFNVEGNMPDVVIETWQYIWNYFSKSTEYQRTFTTDFEVYDLNHPKKVDIFIAVD
jgi:predicted transcriptional regulator YdeE